MVQISYLHRGVQLPFDSSGSRPLGCGCQQGFPLFGVLWIYEWVGRPAFSYLGRGLVEMVLLPFQAVLVSAARDRASSDLEGNNLPVFKIPISWFPNLAFHSMPTPPPSPLPTKGSMVLGNKHNTEYFSLVDLTCYESIKCSQEK